LTPRCPVTDLLGRAGGLVEVDLHFIGVRPLDDLVLEVIAVVVVDRGDPVTQLAQLLTVIVLAFPRPESLLEPVLFVGPALWNTCSSYTRGA
jgi:hypothetical protein